MNGAAGETGLILALGAALLGAVTNLRGLRGGRPQQLRLARTYAWVLLLGALISVLSLEHALVTRDFSIAYVAHNDSVSTPLLFRITAMWSNLAGSILLWGLVLAGYIVAVSVRFARRAEDPLVGWAMTISYGIAAFFFALMLTAANPFSPVKGPVPADGPGPDPLLQNHILVAFHPPLLYLGLVGFTVPFAFAGASLITGRVGEGWLVETRRWTLFAWAFLTIGVVLGAWWSYEVLGWGGYWAWDPVENAAFLPWLTATAYLHSVMVQERRGMLRVWNLSLLAATFSLTILATFLTRSGVLDSVHSFGNTGVGPALLGLFGAVVAGSVVLLAWRGDQLRSPRSIASPLSREAAFLANNLVFGAFALIVLLGTVFPLLYQAVEGSSITVGSPYFDRMTLPVVLCLLFLMAVAPVLPWRQAPEGWLRDKLLAPAAVAAVTVAVVVAAGGRGLEPLCAFALAAFAGASALRQLLLQARGRGVRGLAGPSGGGMVVHLGVILIAVGFAASHSYARQAQMTLARAQTGHLAGHSFTYLGTRNVATPTHTALEALVRIDGGPVYAPAVSDFADATEGIGTPSVRSGPTEDIYLTIASTPSTPGGPVVLGVIIEPLVSWIWAGGAVMLVGAGLSAAPRLRRRHRGPTGVTQTLDPPGHDTEATTEVAAGGPGAAVTPEPVAGA